VLLSGDAAEDVKEVYEGVETLIAIGTQAGKVLIFNILGLLIHEIALGVSVTAVEWVGDMTAPSLLPIRGSSLSPEPRSVVDIVEAEQPTSSDEGTGTVKKVASSHKQAVTRKSIPMRSPPDLFSDEPRGPKSRVPSRRTSDVLRGSPLRVERSRERPVKKALVRPRISTETFDSPPGPSSSGVPDTKVSHSFIRADPPIHESRRWPQVHQAPSVPTPLRAQACSTSQRSASSSPESDFSDEDQEWFTPPSTRRCKGKAPRRDLSPESFPSAPTLASIRPMPFTKTSPTAFDTLNKNYSRPISRILKESSGQHQEAMVEVSKRSVIVPKAAGRHVTILDPELSSPFDSPSSLYSRATAPMLERLPVGKVKEHSADQRIGVLAGPKTLVLKPALVNVDPDPVLSSSVCSSSTSTPSKIIDATSERRFTDIAGSSELKTTPHTPPSRVAASIAAGSSSSSLDIIYSLPSRPKAEINFVQNHSPRNPTTAIHRQLTPNSLDTRADSPSSVYSRSISGMAGGASQANAIIEDTDRSVSSNAPMTPQHQLSIHALGTPISTSSPTGLYSQPTPRMFLDRSHAVDGPPAEKAKNVGSGVVTAKARTVAEEMTCLAEDQRTLRREVAALREEYRVLKGVLLKPKV